MNNDELERHLRAQSGPREEGYMPARIPTSLYEPSTPRSSALMRSAVLVPAVAGGVLAVAVAGALLRGSGSPNVGGNTSPAVAPTESPSSALLTRCSADDIRVEAEDWGGAAGSRGTVLTLRQSNPRASCLMSTPVQVSVLSGSAQLVSGETAVPTKALVFSGTSLWTIDVVWSNWCEATPKPPYIVDLEVGDGALTSIDPGGGNVTPPPCNGDGPSHLSVSVQPAP